MNEVTLAVVNSNKNIAIEPLTKPADLISVQPYKL